jgi:hypothetical protein
MGVAKHMPKQLDYTTSIARTQNDGIHGILFSWHTTFTRLNHLANKRKPKLIGIWDMDWTTSKLNHFNLRMLCESFTPKSILVLPMMLGFKIIRISSEHYTSGTFSNVFGFFWHITHFRRTLIFNQCTLQT